MFTGYDMDRTMLRIGAMNMMTHGVEDPAIEYRDSLSDQNTDADKYTMILANPPFRRILHRHIRRLFVLIDRQIIPVFRNFRLRHEKRLLRPLPPYSYVTGNAMALDDLSDDIDIQYLYYYLLFRGFSDVITGSLQISHRFLCLAITPSPPTPPAPL